MALGLPRDNLIRPLLAHHDGYGYLYLIFLPTLAFWLQFFFFFFSPKALPSAYSHVIDEGAKNPTFIKHLLIPNLLVRK